MGQTEDSARFTEGLVERFLRYVSFDTQSDEDALEQPTTDRQRLLASTLAEELRLLGAEVDYDRENTYVYAFFPSGEGRAVGFIAHMDTSPAVSGAGVKPRIIHQYDGTDEALNPADFPELHEHIGEDLITTDGTTLLGADDKAGIAEIMTMLAYYKEHPELSRRPIAIAFTPDEEVGRGTEHFDLSRFKAGEAYTVDGGRFGVLEYECFNAAQAKVRFRGQNVHPGSAKGRMKNAIRLAMLFDAALPKAEIPEKTEGYQGFYHLDRIRGDVESAQTEYIIRDHSRKCFEERKQKMRDIGQQIRETYGEDACSVDMKDQYYNMAEVMKDHMELIDRAKDAIRRLGHKPSTSPIRGGTDGAVLSFRGLPCPNLPTGGYNYHSRFEYASIQEMELSARLLIDLAGK
jgi:tripeptide aminopeptidase